MGENAAAYDQPGPHVHEVGRKNDGGAADGDDDQHGSFYVQLGSQSECIH